MLPPMHAAVRDRVHRVRVAGLREVAMVVGVDVVGHLARAVVFAIIGMFLVQAAIYSDPREARGLGGALYTLEQQPYGDWLLAIVAAGFMAYAAYLLLLIVYRRILND